MYYCTHSNGTMLTKKTRASTRHLLFRNPYWQNLIDAAADRMVVKSQIYCKFRTSQDSKKVVSGESQWATILMQYQDYGTSFYLSNTKEFGLFASSRTRIRTTQQESGSPQIVIFLYEKKSVGKRSNSLLSDTAPLSSPPKSGLSCFHGYSSIVTMLTAGHYDWSQIGARSLSTKLRRRRKIMRIFHAGCGYQLVGIVPCNAPLAI